MSKNIKVRRIMMCIVGVLLCGISVGFFKKAAFGVDPFTSFMCGLDAVVPDSLVGYGTLYVIVNIVLLSFSLIFDRHYIGLATFINLFLLGYITQFTQAILDSIVPDAPMLVRIIFLIIAIFVMCFSAAMYFTADLGVSTYDAVALIMSDGWKVGPFKFVRIATDLTCVIIGIILYIWAGNSFSSVPEIVGVGTIITAFFMGPLVDFFNVKIMRPLLGAEKTEE